LTLVAYNWLEQW